MKKYEFTGAMKNGMIRLRRFPRALQHAIERGLASSDALAGTVQVRVNERRVEPMVLEQWDEHRGGWFAVPIVVTE